MERRFFHNELFICVRNQNNEIKKGCGVMLFVPLRLAPKEREDLNIFDKSKFESSWVECRCNFSNICESKMLLDVTYNLLKANQIDSLEQLSRNFDNATCEPLPITTMGDYNLDFFTTLERENLETANLPYGFSVAGPIFLTHICETTKTHFVYILTERIPDEKSFVFDSPFKTGHLGCALFTDITVGKLSRIIIHCFDLKKFDKIAFCKTLSGLPWFKVYQCSTPSDKFDMFVNLLSSAAEKHAPLEKVFLTKKIPKLLKESWFGHDCKNLLAKRQLAFKKYCQNASADNWSDSIENGNVVHAVFLDLSEAFDSLSHGIFLKKLKSLSFSHSAIECIESFLTKRLQKVTVNKIVSDWIKLKESVPEGTVLGSLLFNLYVNDLSDQIRENAHIIQSADDCLLYCSDSESEISLNR